MARRKEVTRGPDFPYDQLDELFEAFDGSATEFIEMAARNVRKWLQETGDIFAMEEGWQVRVGEPNGWTGLLMFHGPRDLDQDGKMEGMLEAKFFPPRKEASQEQSSSPDGLAGYPTEGREEAPTSV